MALKEPVELTAETITDYLSKLCKNTVSIFKSLETIHNDNLEIKKLLENHIKLLTTQKILIKSNSLNGIVDDEDGLVSMIKKDVKPNPILTTHVSPQTSNGHIEPQVVNEQSISIPQMQSTVLPGEQPLSVKDQIQLALRKKQLENSAKELRCFQNQHQPQWLGATAEDQKILQNFKPDTSGLV